ncbi:hypothetical protein BH686_04285 [Rhodococcus erythropolis]|uniref:hypothetical protein n=1 Tax=Rhodococcus erythropolis TaxID=1833 RepID=UPI000A09FF74|nr:hypothetical protein [Rhodococcus erythropolis]ORI21818.1 hypothetical protein BH686_04285 [Rhodococcus erythropolis]
MHLPALGRPDRTLEIHMNQPMWKSTEQDPFTEADLARIEQEYADHETLVSGMDPEQARSLWELEDGYLVFAAEVNTIRIGRGHIYGLSSWWVDLQSQMAPTHGHPTDGWEYQAHFPGAFTPDWINWLYTQWFG